MSAPQIQIDGDRLMVRFDHFGIDAYGTFLKAKRLPEYQIITGDDGLATAITAPARFAHMLGVQLPKKRRKSLAMNPKLLDDQEYIVRTALDAKRFACWSDCGLGKGLRPDCQVLTPLGFTALENLHEGDEVIGADGRATRIVGYFRRGVQPFYRVTFSDGVSIECDADHLWNVKSYNDVARGKPWRTIGTAELARTQLKYGTHGQSRTWQIPLVAPVQHDEIHLPIKPYLLGVLLGDGCIGVGSVTVSKPDEELVLLAAAELPSGCQIVDRPSRGCRTWAIVGGGKGLLNPIVDHLRAMGLDGKKSAEKFIPHGYFVAPANARLSLLQGLMDTDGYAGESPEFCSTSKALADGVIRLVESLGGTSSIAVKESPQYTYKGERRCGQTAYRVVFTLPPEFNPFRLSRKADAYRPASRGLGRWIDSIEPVEAGESICIKVDAPDGLFVIDRYVVTHNTFIQLEWCRQVCHTTGGRVLIVTLNEIVAEFLKEAEKWYGDKLTLTVLHTRQAMKEWCATGPAGTIAITNYEKFNHKTEADQVVSELRSLAGICLDESSRLKTGGGKQKWALIKSARGIEYKLSCTATPAPNEIMEFASQASFLEKMRADSSSGDGAQEIIWTYFRRDEKTHRWTVRKHARAAFFEFMSSWSIYIRDPRKFGWRRGIEFPPDPEFVHHPLPLTDEQRQFIMDHNAKMLPDNEDTASMFADEGNAITVGKLSQAAKGFVYVNRPDGSRDVRPVASLKPAKVAEIIREENAAGRQVLVWTEFDAETDLIVQALGDMPHAVLTGKVAKGKRAGIVERFVSGEIPNLISRSDLLGFGQNFQHCGAEVFSGWSFSFQDFYQAIRRAWRFGQKQSVRVHIPFIKELEGQQWDAIERKSRQYEESVAEMEANYVKVLGLKRKDGAA